MFGFGKDKPSKKMPEIDPALFQDLRRAVRNHIKEKLSSGQMPSPEQGLYVLGCFAMADWDSSGIWLYWATEEMFEKEASKWPEMSESMRQERVAVYRWNPVEFGGAVSGSICNEAMDELWEAYNVQELDDSIQEPVYLDFQARAQFAVIQALKDLVRTGAFGLPESLANLTLLSGAMDSEEIMEETTLVLSVRILNKPEVANRFFEQWIPISHTKGTVPDWTDAYLAKAKGTLLQQLLDAPK